MVGMGADGLPDSVRERFANHIESILRRSAMPAVDRQDVAEELLGHLDARYSDGRATGLAPDDAASRAIAGFGGADVIGREFMESYHGRLWASTIGQLLPVGQAAGHPPGVVVWMARFDRAMALFSVLAAVALLLTASPVRAAVGVTLGIAAAGILWLAAEALRRGQIWAVAVSAFALLFNAVTFFASLGQPPGGWTISINGLIGLLLLIWLLADIPAVTDWVAGSTTLGERLGWPIGIAVIAWALMAAFGPSLPDPTQIGPEDIDASASVTCAATTLEDGTHIVPAPTVVIVIAYHRTDLAPRGIVRDASSWGDTIDVIANPTAARIGPPTATSQEGDGSAEPIDVSTIIGEGPSQTVLGSVAPFGDVTIVPAAAGILGVDQVAGRTIRITVPTTMDLVDDRVPAEVGTPLPGSEVDVRLHHLDRFVLNATIPCGGQARLLNGRDR
jgi:hypothetical protein